MEEESQPTRHVLIRVRGRVQGVGFRRDAHARASMLGINAVARNLDDGSVLIEATGPNDAIESFIAWAHVGPPAASVDSVAVEDVSDDPGPVH
jgi:acylphosphatase